MESDFIAYGAAGKLEHAANGRARGHNPSVIGLQYVHVTGLVVTILHIAQGSRKYRRVAGPTPTHTLVYTSRVASVAFRWGPDTVE